jgi:hypothetical protein
MRRNVVYLYSGAHNLGKRTFHPLALGDNGKVVNTGVKVHQRITSCVAGEHSRI